MHFLRTILAAAALFALGLPVTARADGGILDELRLGVYEHDISLLGHQKEKGQDAGIELLFPSPGFLATIWSPRPVVGALINSAGETDQAYLGLTWTWDFAKSVFTRDDGFYAEATLGGGWNDGHINVTDPIQGQHLKSLGSHALFREDLDFGYRFNPTWSIALSYNHISNADLGVRNEGLNDLGIRFGVKF